MLNGNLKLRYANENYVNNTPRKHPCANPKLISVFEPLSLNLEKCYRVCVNMRHPVAGAYWRIRTTVRKPSNNWTSSSSSPQEPTLLELRKWLGALRRMQIPPIPPQKTTRQDDKMHNRRFSSFGNCIIHCFIISWTDCFHNNFLLHVPSSIAQSFLPSAIVSSRNQT